jgi:hypothetical protein
MTPARLITARLPAAMGGQNLSAVAARRPAGMGYLRADVLGERRSLIYLLDIFRLAAWPARPG